MSRFETPPPPARRADREDRLAMPTPARRRRQRSRNVTPPPQHLRLTPEQLRRLLWAPLRRPVGGSRLIDGAVEECVREDEVASHVGDEEDPPKAHLDEEANGAVAAADEEVVLGGVSSGAVVAATPPKLDNTKRPREGRRHRRTSIAGRPTMATAADYVSPSPEKQKKKHARRITDPPLQLDTGAAAGGSMMEEA
ncbi:unnamed protein product [Vitrella brassicaformis CCMP3155]|uniref:Uncharacterized protein n=2 Tax=Vitrella brassicaformis TaxID=1169539 RepID=A0A0G4GQ21_VITBC|nr:unnamed protein product [Vitrella brassicaformis CCMP3155]|eukprot:CEM32307.1 unnamed protein product [Vitrella brassicaformis CCMP3155]